MEEKEPGGGACDDGKTLSCRVEFCPETQVELVRSTWKPALVCSPVRRGAGSLEPGGWSRCQSAARGKEENLSLRLIPAVL